MSIHVSLRAITTRTRLCRPTSTAKITRPTAAHTKANKPLLGDNPKANPAANVAPIRPLQPATAPVRSAYAPSARPVQQQQAPSPISAAVARPAAPPVSTRVVQAAPIQTAPVEPQYVQEEYVQEGAPEEQQFVQAEQGGAPTEGAIQEGLNDKFEALMSAK